MKPCPPDERQRVQVRRRGPFWTYRVDSPRWHMGWWALTRSGLERQVGGALVAFGRERAFAHKSVRMAIVAMALDHPYIYVGSESEIDRHPPRPDVLIQVEA